MRSKDFATPTMVLLLVVGLSPLVAGQETCQKPSPEGKRHGPSAKGIHVGTPRIYGDRSLELMLQTAESRLATLQFLDQASIAARVGTLQGGAGQQSSFSVQATGLPLAQVLTKLTAGTQPSGATSGRETTTTEPSVAPAIPNLPTGGAPALPTSFSPSALDVLNEQMQLTYEVANLRLLLEGSLTDLFTSPRSGQQFKKTATIGFPISIEVPNDSRYDRALVELTVTVSQAEKPPDDNGKPLQLTDPPGVRTILPRERSYNEAAITDKSKGFGLAVVTHVFSVGVAGSKRAQTYYVVQDLDTVAFERGEGCDSLSMADPENKPTAGCETIFGWEFRPTLGRKKLKSGLRQTFVQLSFPVNGEPKTLGAVTVEARWRQYDPQTGAVGKYIEDDSGKSTVLICREDLPNYDLRPPWPWVNWSEAANGQIYVEAWGHYLRGTAVSIGESALREGSPGFSLDSTGIRFLVPAIQLLTFEEAWLVPPGGERGYLRDRPDQTLSEAKRALGDLLNEQAKPENLKDKTQEVREGLQGRAARWWLDQVAPDSKATTLTTNDVQAFRDRLDRPLLSIETAEARPWSTSEYEVDIHYKTAVNMNTRPLVLIGDQVFGLSSRPYREQACLQSDNCTLVFRAPRALVRSARMLKMKQLFLGPSATAQKDIRILDDFTATKIVAVGKTKDCTLFAVQGSELNEIDKIKVRIGEVEVGGAAPAPPCQFGAPPASRAAASRVSRRPSQSPAGGCPVSAAYKDKSLGSSTLLLALPNCLLEGVKMIQLYREGNGDVQSVLLPLEAPKPEGAEVENIEVPLYTRSVTLKGKHLEQIDLNGIVYNGVPLEAKLGADGTTVLSLSEAMYKNPGFYALSISLKDKKKIGGLVHITKPEE